MCLAGPIQTDSSTSRRRSATSVDRSPAGAPGNRTRRCAVYRTGSRDHRSAPASVHPAFRYIDKVRRSLFAPATITKAESARAKAMPRRLLYRWGLDVVGKRFEARAVDGFHATTVELDCAGAFFNRGQTHARPCREPFRPLRQFAPARDVRRPEGRASYPRTCVRIE